MYQEVELAFLIISGLTLGTGLGVLVSQQFIPYWQIGANGAELVPPYLVEIAWPAVTQVYLLFGLMFFVALTVLVILLRRMKIFQAIKLGGDGLTRKNSEPRNSELANSPCLTQ